MPANSTSSSDQLTSTRSRTHTLTLYLSPKSEDMYNTTLETIHNALLLVHARTGTIIPFDNFSLTLATRSFPQQVFYHDNVTASANPTAGGERYRTRAESIEYCVRRDIISLRRSIRTVGYRSLTEEEGEAIDRVLELVLVAVKDKGATRTDLFDLETSKETIDSAWAREQVRRQTRREASGRSSQVFRSDHS